MIKFAYEIVYERFHSSHDENDMNYTKFSSFVLTWYICCFSSNYVNMSGPFCNEFAKLATARGKQCELTVNRYTLPLDIKECCLILFHAVRQIYCHHCHREC